MLPQRVWIDTSNAIFRRGLCWCALDAGFAVVGESEALTPVPELEAADVLVFDFDQLPHVRLLEDTDSTHLVALVDAVDEALLPKLLEADVDGYLVGAQMRPSELAACLRTVVSGGCWYPAAPRRLRPTSRQRLTPREVAVLQLLADGDRTIEIARALSYSERMVKNIVHDVMTKMECRTRAQAVALVVREHVI
jgi:DNA-binding NarL/FixJ family response regulator